MSLTNEQQAFRYLQLAANQGIAEAQFNLVVMYTNGQGVEQNDQEALRYLQLAANQGNTEAQFNLGVMYAKGQWVEQNGQEALRYLQLSAAQGHAQAQGALEEIYRQGRGVFNHEQQAAADHAPLAEAMVSFDEQTQVIQGAATADNGSSSDSIPNLLHLDEPVEDQRKI